MPRTSKKKKGDVGPIKGFVRKRETMNPSQRKENRKKKSVYAAECLANRLLNKVGKEEWTTLQVSHMQVLAAPLQEEELRGFI